MNFDEIYKNIKKLSGYPEESRDVSALYESHGAINVVVQKHYLLPFVISLKNHKIHKCDQLIDIVCIDNSKFPGHKSSNECRFELAYLFLSISFNTRYIVRVKVAEDSGVDSVSSIFPSALWCEREVWDMFGVTFEQHPDHRRILSEYGYVHFPLRKDFPVFGYSEVYYNESRDMIAFRSGNSEAEYNDFDFESSWRGNIK